MSDSITITPDQSALILIDLQKGIVKYPVAPHSSSIVLSNAARLADHFRQNNAFVVLVHVGFSNDGKDAINVPTDTSFSGGERPADWMEFAPELNKAESDFVITKKQWGAFYGTSLDLQLRRRGIDTLVMGGIATNFGVESTARAAYERNYTQIFAEDAMTDLSEEAHHFAINYVFKRMGHVRSTEEIITALK